MVSVSIIMPSYQYAAYLSTAITSVLSQSFSDFELIIVDDGSADGSFEIATSFSERDPRVRVFKNEKNLGIVSTLEIGLGHSKALYVHGLSADDYYLPRFLEANMALLSRHPEIGLTFSDSGIWETSLRSIQCVANARKPLIVPKEKTLSFFQKSYFGISCHSCVVKKELLFKHGFYNPKLGALDDWFLFHKIALSEGVGYIPETLSVMRVHSQSRSNKANKNVLYKNLLYHLLEAENPETAYNFSQSALLGFIFKPLFFKCLYQPRTWQFYPPLIRKSLRNKIRKLFKKPYLSDAFINSLEDFFSRDCKVQKE